MERLGTVTDNHFVLFNSMELVYIHYKFIAPSPFLQGFWGTFMAWVSVGGLPYKKSEG